MDCFWGAGESGLRYQVSDLKNVQVRKNRFPRWDFFRSVLAIHFCAISWRVLQNNMVWSMLCKRCWRGVRDSAMFCD